MSARGTVIPMACASLLLLLGFAAFDARAQDGTLDAPMHPIDKLDGTPSRCARCPAAHVGDLDSQRVADRTAPEYAGTRRESVPEMEPPENAGAGVAGGAQLPPIALPLR